MNMEKLKELLNDMPNTLIVTKLKIELINKHHQVHIIEFDEDQLKLTRNKRRIDKFYLWRRKSPLTIK
jgi:hypothetical protein